MRLFSSDQIIAPFWRHRSSKLLKALLGAFPINALLITVSVFSLISPSQAEITFIQVDGASNVTGIDSSDDENVADKIFGGTAGADCSGGTLNGDGTCSNCSAQAFETACNDARIYPGLELSIQFRSNSVSGNTLLENSEGATSGLPLNNAGSNVSQGSTHTARVQWQNVCEAVFDNVTSSCIGDEEGTLTVGVDGNGDGDLDDEEDDKTTIEIQVSNTIEDVTKACEDSTITTEFGLCDFTVFPGDGKVFLQEIEVPSGFPTGTNPDIEFLRFYFAEFDTTDTTDDQTKFSSITHDNLFFEVEIDVDSENVATPKQDNFADGITNGKQYYFRAASVDLAGNVGFHTPITRTDTATAFHNAAQHSATPSEVSALLTEGFQCFVATAAFGSPFKKKVKTLRNFRDKYLLNNWLGKKFVEFYYWASPPLAKVIERNETLKTGSRILLWPFVLWAEISLEYGLVGMFFPLTLGLILLSLWVIWRRKKAVTATL